VLIGMGSILLNHCRVGACSVIGAGSLVPEGMVVPPRSLVLGRPARVVRALSDDEVAEITAGAVHYRALLAEHRVARNVWTESVQRPTVEGRCPP
jgi:carbonic anhydrase/acetyltransferase-like protein (isoleucine patch superfamily)